MTDNTSAPTGTSRLSFCCHKCGVLLDVRESADHNCGVDKSKMTKPIITDTPEKIRDFLSKPEGRKFFREITSDYSNSRRQELKKSMISPKEASRRRTAVQEILILEINK